jgi:UDP-N-acetylglucosamine 2-epimerase
MPSVSEGYNLLTIHRQENMDLDILEGHFRRIRCSSKEFIFPCHPRTRQVIKSLVSYDKIPKNIKLKKPVGYIEMMSLLKGCDKVWTDSGGLQREAIFAGKPCEVLRERTEWVETEKWEFGDGRAAEHIWNVLDDAKSIKLGLYG